MTNQEFCYWLQGYFEISRKPSITKEKIIAIDLCLKKINQPLGEYTQWLSDVISFFSEQDYPQGLMEYFIKEIIRKLSLIFLHVIDNSYDTELTQEETQLIHDGGAR